MLDDGHEARAEAKKTSAVESGEVDKAMTSEWASKFFLIEKPSEWTDVLTEALLMILCNFSIPRP
jgi:hypothetical protein